MFANIIKVIKRAESQNINKLYDKIPCLIQASLKTKMSELRKFEIPYRS
ncbi:MAG TPA: hypothetical protein PK816_00515 [Candidatus Cloacimonadota bacterium]|jgi:hypothetical protein|nr:hypothetical protein [Candidatus Cloacimonadota bacterium]